MAKGTLNKVILIGRLGADPEIKNTTSGTIIGNLRLATNEVYKDKTTGQNQEQTEWHKVVLFGKTAELAGQYLKKGSSVYIEGRIRTTKWQDQNGQDRYSTEIVGNEMQFLGGRDHNSQNDYNQEHSAPASNNMPAQSQNTPSFTHPSQVQTEPQFQDDEIPF